MIFFFLQEKVKRKNGHWEGREENQDCLSQDWGRSPPSPQLGIKVSLDSGSRDPGLIKREKKSKVGETFLEGRGAEVRGHLKAGGRSWVLRTLDTSPG